MRRTSVILISAALLATTPDSADDAGKGPRSPDCSKQHAGGASTCSTGSQRPSGISIEELAPHPLGGASRPILRMQLAGNALGAYPYFEFVRAFNEDAGIRVAVDPTVHDATAGKTCDIHIVESRTAAAWSADPTLTDVTAGGPLTVTLDGATIQDNTFVVSGPFELSADAGIGLGVGYDVVLDCDRDGRLAGGDAIDGLGDEAGLFVVHDVTLPGPLAVVEIDYSVGSVFDIPAGQTRQNTLYPAAIATLGRLPLVVISHGNGHDYRWYDHIGEHLASYGFIVMSHQNDTEPGIESASTTTLGHTDAILDQQAMIAQGILAGHIDTSRIVWIGHSRGAEGIVRAYDRIYDGHYQPTHFDLDDLVLLSSMAPTDFQGPAQSNPHDASFHVWTAGGDDDVSGAADEGDSVDTFHIYERATGFRQSTVIQGAGHGDFHNAQGSVFSGPCKITPKAEVHKILKGYLLPLVLHYLKRNVPAKDFLWRQYESFRPIGAPVGPCVVVTHEFQPADSPYGFVIDDYQQQTGPETSSSNGEIRFTVSAISETLLRDQDDDYAWTPVDSMNGMNRARGSDTSRGVTFGWSAASSYEFEIVEGRRDFRNFDFLSFRACQQTRHPDTVAELGDLTFSVTLKDSSGAQSSIEIGAYGGGVEEPYQRLGGWFNEFETTRMRLSDFLHGGSGLDLAHIEALAFEFGGSAGSPAGRIGLDSVLVSADLEPPLPGAVEIRLPAGEPDPLAEGFATTFPVTVSAAGEEVIAGSPVLYHRFVPGGFTETPLVSLGGDQYEATLPAPRCSDAPEYFLVARGSISGLTQLPPGAPFEVFSPSIGQQVVISADDFENDNGWVAENLGASSGEWERGVPVNDPGWQYDPTSDADGSGSCFLTRNTNGNTDVDGGAVRLTSPTLDLSAPGFSIGYEYYLRLTNENGTDHLLVEISTADGAAPWVEIARQDTDGGQSWRIVAIDRGTIEAAGVIPGAASRIRFTLNDGDPPSIVEGGIDAFQVSRVVCE